MHGRFERIEYSSEEELAQNKKDGKVKGDMNKKKKYKRIATEEDTDVSAILDSTEFSKRSTMKRWNLLLLFQD